MVLTGSFHPIGAHSSHRCPAADPPLPWAPQTAAQLTAQARDKRTAAVSENRDKMDIEVELAKEPSTEEVVARQQALIARLESTFHLWEAAVDLDRLSLAGGARKATAGPQFHQFGAAVEEPDLSSRRLDEAGEALSRPPPTIAKGFVPSPAQLQEPDLSRLRLEERPPPTIVVTSPEPEGCDPTVELLSRMSLAQDGLLAAAAAAASESKARHPEKCSMCGLERRLRSHRARCSRRRGVHFPCPTCRAPFARRTELVAHMKRVGRGGEDATPCPSCALCRRSYKARGWGGKLGGTRGEVYVQGCGFVDVGDS